MDCVTCGGEGGLDEGFGAVVPCYGCNGTGIEPQADLAELVIVPARVVSSCCGEDPFIEDGGTPVEQVRCGQCRAVLGPLRPWPAEQPRPIKEDGQ